MLNSVVDIAGINRISRMILGEAAAAMAGMVECSLRNSAIRKSECRNRDRPLIAATMFGVTTPCVQHARKILEEAGYEVLVFHATGNGGQAMESLIRDGLIAGVLDITTTELADELVGGVLSAGPDAADRGRRAGHSAGRLRRRARHGQLRPARDRPRRNSQSRKFHVHNASVTLMRTTPEENAQLGEEIGRKLAAATGPAAILLPLQGVSAIDRAGQPFDDPAARAALFDGIRAQPRQRRADRAGSPHQRSGVRRSRRTKAAGHFSILGSIGSNHETFSESLFSPATASGSEVIDEAVRVLDRVQQLDGGFALEFTPLPWGVEHWKQHGKVVPDDFLDVLRPLDAILLGAVGWPELVPDHITLAPLVKDPPGVRSIRLRAAQPALSGREERAGGQAARRTSTSSSSARTAKGNTSITAAG